MAHVYILQSKRNGKYYIGSTAGSVESRVKRHQQGGVSFTRRNLPVVLVLTQQCPDMNIAREIERKLKDLKRKDYIAKMVSEGRIKLLDRYVKGVDGSDAPLRDK
jgi:predicted GIY-YIG superfamily endonuclease